MKKYKIHPLFVLYLIFLIFIGQYESLLVYFFVVCIHEFAHSSVAKKLGYKLEKLTLMPYGVCLNYNTNFFSPNDEILIAISGPFVNFFLSILCFASWWIYPILMPYFQLFCYANIVLFVFNLLPCYPLDGGRVLSAIITKKFDKKVAIKICVVLNVCISLVFTFAFVLGLFFGVINTNLLIIALFLFVGILEPQKSTSYNYLSINVNRKKNLCGKQIKFTFVRSSEKIYKLISKMSKHKFNVFYVVFDDDHIKIMTEIKLQKLAVAYGPTCSCDEIFF